MQWLSSTKIAHKFCLYTSVANKALTLLAKASGLANTTEYWPLAMAVLVPGWWCLFGQASSLDFSGRQGMKLIFHQSWKRWYHNCNTWSWWTCLNLAKKVPTERSSLENNRFPKSGWQIHKYILPTSSLYPFHGALPGRAEYYTVYLGLLPHVGKLSERRFVQHENLQSLTCLRPNANFYSAHPMNNGVERP